MTKALPKATGLKTLTLSSGKGIDIEFKPTIAVIAGSIDKLGLDIRSFREPLKQSLVQVIIPSIQKNFHVEGRPKWQRLSELTVARKGFTNILLDSGKLYKTMQRQNIWSLTKDYLILKDLPQAVWYGKVHQAGGQGTARSSRLKIVGQKGAGRNVGGDIPARPFVMLQAEDERRIESIFRHWLDERVQRAAWRMR